MTRAERLRDGTAEDRIAVLQDIAASVAPAPEEIELVIDCLSDERKAVQRRAAEAASHCARLAPGVIDRLEAVLHSGPLRQRWGAVFALSLFGAVPQSALATLLQALDSDDGDVRWAAADLVKNMAQRESPLVTDALLLAARDGARNQRKMALYILRDLRSRAAVAVAIDALHGAAIEVRLAALSALVALSPDKADAVGHVLPLVDDEDQRIRRAAAAALGQLGVKTDAVLVALAAATKADDPALQRAATRALEHLVAC